jgi:hypothetical protein
MHVDNKVPCWPNIHMYVIFYLVLGDPYISMYNTDYNKDDHFTNSLIAKRLHISVMSAMNLRVS